jgi:hypothetical protein
MTSPDAIKATLDALRRVREIRHRKAAIDRMRQHRVTEQTAQSVADARARMVRELAARHALAQRVTSDAGQARMSPRALQDTVFEDLSRMRAAGLAHEEAQRAGERHRREEGRLAQLQTRLNRAQASLDKLERVANDTGRGALRAQQAREDDEADEAALRRYGTAAASLLDDAHTANDEPWSPRGGDRDTDGR